MGKRARILEKIFKGASYTARSICDMLVGLLLVLNYDILLEIGRFKVAISILVVQSLPKLLTNMISKYMNDRSRISDLERDLI